MKRKKITFAVYDYVMNILWGFSTSVTSEGAVEEIMGHSLKRCYNSVREDFYAIPFR